MLSGLTLWSRDDVIDVMLCNFSFIFLLFQLARWEATIPIHLMTREEFVLTFPDQAFGLDQKKYQTMWPHDYDPKYGIPGEVGSGTWNFGPTRHLEKPKEEH